MNTRCISPARGATVPGPTCRSATYSNPKGRTKLRVCSIEGCGKAVRKRGWCAAHYTRFLRYGDPLGGSTRKGEASAFLESTVFSFEGNECLIWPFSTNSGGYGKVWHDGKTRDVHRIVCEREHGPPPTPRHQAAHSCGKGHLGCVNRKHLEWKTPRENEADKFIHGTSARGGRNAAAKLTESQVLEIRASVKPERELAEEFGISKAQVSAIRTRKKWAWLKDNTFPEAATVQPGRTVSGPIAPLGGATGTFNFANSRINHCLIL